MHFLSPLRYPGGKRKLANFMRLLIRHNDLTGVEYVEPYAGGASVALSLLFGEFASQIHINDFDPAIAALWHTILDFPEELCQRIRDISVDMGEWERQRAIHEAIDPDPLDLAFSTFFLNRTNRSGIIRGGVIGGKDQSGDWKIDARFNKDDLIFRIQKIARYRSRIRTYCLDGADFISNVLPLLPERALIYLDPPYYVKGRGLYEHHYQHEDHKQIANLVPSIRQYWVVSYDYVPEIDDMYQGFPRSIYGIHYSAQDRYKGTEVMFFSPKLSVPEVGDPSKVRAREANRPIAQYTSSSALI